MDDNHFIIIDFNDPYDPEDDHALYYVAVLAESNGESWFYADLSLAREIALDPRYLLYSLHADGEFSKLRKEFPKIAREIMRHPGGRGQA